MAARPSPGEEPGEGEEEEIPTFPPELDEFLEYCVSERGGDFEAISSDFLDIAAELEEPLAERAQEFFSPEALWQRWQLLSGEAVAGAGEAEAGADEAGTCKVATTAVAGEGLPGQGAATAPVALAVDTAAISEATATVAAAEETEGPSGFSVLKDSLKTHIDKLYSEVQNHLPSTADRGGSECEDSEEGSEEEGPRVIAGPEFGAPMPAVRTELPSGTQLNDLGGAEFRQRTLELFGTDDLNKIFTGLAKGPDVSTSVPSFDAVLLSHGVNPQDIEGPMVQPPAVFQQLLEGMGAPVAADATDQMSPPAAPVPAAAVPAAAVTATTPTAVTRALATGAPILVKAAPTGAGAASAATAPSLAAGIAAGGADGNAAGPASWRAKSATAWPWPSGSLGSVAVAEGSERLEDKGTSDDSSDEDFEQLRRSMKSSSLEIVSSQEVTDSVTVRSPTDAIRRPAFQPPARAPAQPARAMPAISARPTPKGSAKPRQPKEGFVKLELMESSEEEEEEEPLEDAGCSSDSTDPGDRPLEDEDEQDAEPVRVLSQLLRKAPTGDCPWDVWLNATRRWPRLQVVLDNPEFFRRGDDLRVAFGSEKLREVREEQRRLRAEKQLQRAAAAERLKSGVSEFIKEAERRRELIHGRISGGFVLHSATAELEEQRERQRRQQQETKEMKLQQQGLEQEKREEREEKKEPEERQQPDGQHHAMVFRRPQLPPELEAERARYREERDAARKQREIEQQQRTQVEAAKEEGQSRRRLLEKAAMEAQCSLYERQVSAGPPLAMLSAHAEALLCTRSSPGAAAGCAAYAIPWGAPGGAVASTPTAEQGEALGLVHCGGLAEGLLLVSARMLLPAGLRDAVGDYAAVVLVFLPASRAEAALQAVLPSGQPLAKALLGPLPLLPLEALLRQPLALWALEAAPRARLEEGSKLATGVETVCVALRPGSGASGAAVLAAVLADVRDEGLDVVGLRLAFPDAASAAAVTSAALRSAVRAGQPTLLLAVRGPYALSVWRSLLGPADPQLARQTDPSSLNARFGGHGRNEAVALAPPSSNTRAQADLAWAFGGRVDTAQVELPSKPLHVISVEAPRVYALRLTGRLTFAGAGTLVGSLLLRLGRILSFAATEVDCFVAATVREGGGSFVEGCGRLLRAPPPDLVDGHMAKARSPLACTAELGSWSDCGLLGVTAQLCKIPSQRGLLLHATHLPEAGPDLGEACRLGEPEILVVGLRPQGSMPAPLLVRHVCDGLFAKFGPQALSSLDIGRSVDLLTVRLLDFPALHAEVAATAQQQLDEHPPQLHQQPASGGAASQAALEAGLQALRGFQSFAQVVRRAPAEACDGWWEAGKAGGPAALLCFRGEDLIGRFRTFLAKEWKLPAAMAGDVLFAPDLFLARQAFHVFLTQPGLTPPFGPTVPPTDLRSLQRFQPAVEPRGSGQEPPLVAQPSLLLTEASLFLQRLRPELTVAVLLPPTADVGLPRMLAAVEQQGFGLVAAVAGGGLSQTMAYTLFEQELVDGHLQNSDREAFLEAVGQATNAREDEGSFRCFWLVLSRHQAVKRFAQLCGHGDPAVNKQNGHASLRPGRDRVLNGLRCSSSHSCALTLLEALRHELAPLYVPLGAPRERRLGLKSCARVLEMSLAAVALVQATELSAARLLRELHSALTEHGLALVGLHVLSPPPPLAEVEWPGALHGWPEALRQWQKIRPTAGRLAELAGSGRHFVLAACEGPSGAERTRAALAAVSTAAPKGTLECYASASAVEGAADVTHLFGELFGGKHYVVDGGG